MTNKPEEFIPVAETFLVKNEKKYVVEAIESGWVSSKGPFVERFETAFAKYIGTDFAASCSNGTTALHLAYLACGLKANDEILMPNLTFVATANAAAYIGAKPVFVDVDPNTWNMDPQQIEAKITKKTKAIVPVHLYGVPCDMDPILEIAQKHNLKVIEDCAESHGAAFHGKKTGAFGDCAAFSFFGNKIITTGEGGMVVSNNEKLIARVNFLKSHGQDPVKSYWYPETAFNYRMTALQAAFGLGQLEGIDQIIEKKIAVSAYYRRQLKDNPKIRFQDSYPDSKSVYWLNSILVPAEKRDGLAMALKQQAIETRRVFYPLSALPMYSTKERFPASDSISECGLSIPSSCHLSTEQLDRVILAIDQYLG